MKQTIAWTALLALGVVVDAHKGCGHGDIARRNPGGRVIEKRQVTDVASAAASEDPSYECTPYSYAPVTAMQSRYPTIWQQASILSTDTTANALFATINATVNSQFPNIKPHGTTTGDFSGVTYNNTDPDCWWSWKECTTPASSTGLSADITTVPEPMTWGLGFDDGPNCSHNALYDYLQQQKQRATMFFIGSNVMDWPLQALRATTDGHQICVHTWSHLYMTSLSNADAFAELYYTRQAITELLGVTPQCWRPPYGDVDNRIRLIAKMLNMTTIVWSDDTDDWKVGIGGVTSADVDANYQGIIDSASNGTYATHGPVVLNHELNNYTMSEFIKFYPKIKAAFKYIVPIASAMNETTPYTEKNVTYPNFSQYVSGQNASAASTSISGSTTTSSTGSAGASGTSNTAAASSTAAKSSASRIDVGPVGGAVAFLTVFVGCVFL